MLRPFRHRYLEPALCRVLLGTGAALPRSRAWNLARVVGLCASALPLRANRHMARNLHRVAGPLGLRVRPREVYAHMAGGLLDFLHASRLGDEAFLRLVSVEGAEHMAEAMAPGRGTVAVTAHYSAWELIPRAITLLGHKVGVVGRRLWNPRVSRELDVLRSRGGIVTLDRGGGAGKLLRTLRDGTAVGILVDQETKAVEGRFVPFLGLPALTPTGPAALCLRFGIPCVTLHIQRTGTGYRLIIDPPVSPEGLSGPEGVRTLTETLNRRIGEWIIHEPEQWIWFHDRWGRSPAFHRSLR